MKDNLSKGRGRDINIHLIANASRQVYSCPSVLVGVGGKKREALFKSS